MNDCRKNVIFALFLSDFFIHGVFAHHEPLKNMHFSSEKLLSTKTRYLKSLGFFCLFNSNVLDEDHR